MIDKIKILLTAFEPFGEEDINSSIETLNLTADNIDGAEIIKLILPVEYNKSAMLLKEAVYNIEPAAVISMGQAAGRSSITIERVAINLYNADMADNAGIVMKDVPIIEDGAAAYFATIPIGLIIDAIVNDGIPAAQSLSAGAFVCNSLMYNMLEFLPDDIIGGFIHLPITPKQAAAKKGIASMDVVLMAKGITKAIRQIVKTLLNQ